MKRLLETAPKRFNLTPITKSLLDYTAQNAQRLVQQRRKLLEMRVALLQRIKQLAEAAREDTPGYSLHMADAATDSFDRDLTLGLASFEQEGLYEVDAALKRIDDGAYGICESTGRPISWERLAAVPCARFCVEAEKQLEKNVRPHIGAVRSLQPLDKESFEGSLDDSTEWRVESLSRAEPEELIQ
jgi:RNA polymerase-binding protein DksA